MVSELPPLLPVGHLSASSMTTWLRCQVRWKRRYMDAEFEPSKPPQLLGSAVHAAEGTSYRRVVEGEARLTEREVLDAFADEFDLAVEGAPDVDWEDEKPGRVKDTGVVVVRKYHQLVAPAVRPVSVERRFEVDFPGTAWSFRGYIDLETVGERGGTTVDDLKVRSPKRGLVSEAEAASDLQVSAELWGRKQEGNPAEGFRFHNLLRPATARGAVLTPKHVQITPAHRTEGELDTFTELIYRVATAMAKAAENESWMPAPPGAWWCSESFCGFWSSCEFGGARRSVLSPGGPRALRRVSDGDYLRAVEATRIKAGYTTAAKVAVHLGVTVAEASPRLTALARRGALVSQQPTKSSGRGKEKVTVTVAGLRRYSLPVAEIPAA